MQPREQVKHLIDKLNRMPLERLSEVTDFVDFLNTRAQDRMLASSALRVSEPLLTKVWGDPEDAVYDEL